MSIKYLSPGKIEPNDLNAVLSYGINGSEEAKKEQEFTLYQMIDLAMQAEVASHHLLNLMNEMQRGNISLVDMLRTVFANGMNAGFQLNHNFLVLAEPVRSAMNRARQEKEKNDRAKSGESATANSGGSDSNKA